jgi:hypothetical protein
MRINRLKRTKRVAIITGRKPGPGFFRIPTFRLIPSMAKEIPTPIQKKLPIASDPIRLNITCDYLENRNESHE